MAAYEDRFVTAPDGVRLHLRDYPGRDAGGSGRPPLLCLPGLTRNGRDYEALAARVAGDWRVLAMDFRGRGASGKAEDSASYTPATYLADVQAVLAALGIERLVGVGTSLGGIVLMMLAAAQQEHGPGRLAGLLLNDVGPAIEAAGLARIRGYVGRASSHPTWLHAARALAEAQRDIYPDWTLPDWLKMAKRVYRLTEKGKIKLDYDPRIAEPFKVAGGEAPADLWPALDALAGVPMLVVRGERSDVLSAATAARMMAALPGAELVTVPRVGHAPTLDEPVAAAAIERLLARVAGSAAA